MQAKYLSSLEEAVGPDMESNFAPSTNYSVMRDPVDSFSGYSSLLSWNNEDVCGVITPLFIDMLNLLLGI